MYIIVGLGNPGAEYEKTRHNTGRTVLELVRKTFNFSEWKKNGEINALVSDGVFEKEKVRLVMPETFMNKSGQSVLALVGVVGVDGGSKNKNGKVTVNASSAKKAEQLVVIYDDLDLPIGNMKISFNRSSGGHRGVESIIKALKSEAFLRIRVGISPKTPTGKMKKPTGDAVVQDFILGSFKDAELKELARVSSRACEALKLLISSGSSAKAVRLAREKAMGEFNAG